MDIGTRRTSVETTADGSHDDLNGEEGTHAIENSPVFVVDSIDPDNMNG
jgi:hypothetical protein